MANRLSQEIINLKARVSAVFDALEAKGVTLPSTLNLTTLKESIENGDFGTGEPGEIAQSVLDYIERSESTITDSTLTKLGSYTGNKSTFTSVAFNNVEELGSYCFNENTSLTSARFPKATVVGEKAFNGCTNLTNVRFSILENSGSYSFYGCPFTSINSTNFPALKVINSYGFAASALESVSSDTLTKIETSGMQNCTKLTSMNTPNLKEIGINGLRGNSDSETALVDFNFSSLEKLGENAMVWKFGCETVTLPAVKTVGYAALSNNPKVKTFNLPEAVSLSTYSLGYNNATTFNLPKVETVSSNAFCDCQHLEELTLPSIKYMTSYIGEYMHRFTKLNLPNLTSTQNVKLSSLGVQYLKVPSLTTIDSNYRIQSNSKLLELDLPSLTTVNCNSAFTYNASLQKIWIPKEAVCTNTQSYYNSYAPFYNDYFLTVYTDATEEEFASHWPSNYKTLDDNGNTVKFVFGATHADYEAHKVYNLSLSTSSDYWSGLQKVTFENGVCSNFSSNAYAYINGYKYYNHTSGEITVAFTTPESIANNKEVIVRYPEDLCVGLVENSGMKLFVGRDCGSYSELTTLSASTKYYLKIRTVGLSTKAFLSTDGINFSYIGSYDNYSNIGMTYGCYNLIFGSYDDYSFRGSIDFNHCYIKINNEVVWKAFDDMVIPSCVIEEEVSQAETLNEDGLVAHLDFEDSNFGGLPLSSYNNFIVDGSTPYRGSKSATFNNTNQTSFDITSLGLDMDHDFSLSFAFKCKETYSYDAIYCVLRDTNNVSYGIQPNNTQATSSYGNWNTVFIMRDNYVTVQYDTHTNKGGWNKYTITYEAANKCFRCYINGTLVLKNAHMNIESASLKSFIINLTSYNQYYRAFVDDICIYNKCCIEPDALEVVDTDKLAYSWSMDSHGSRDDQSNSYRMFYNGSTHSDSGFESIYCCKPYTSYESQYINGMSVSTDSDFSFELNVRKHTHDDSAETFASSKPKLYFELKDGNDTTFIGMQIQNGGLGGASVVIDGVVSDVVTPSADHLNSDWNKYVVQFDKANSMVYVFCNGHQLISSEYTSSKTAQYVAFYQNQVNSTYCIVDNIRFYRKQLHTGVITGASTLTIVPSESDATVYITKNGVTLEQSSIAGLPGSSVSYRVVKTGFITSKGTYTFGDADETVNVTMVEGEDALPTVNLVEYTLTQYNSSTRTVEASNTSIENDNGEVNTTITFLGGDPQERVMYGNLLIYCNVKMRIPVYSVGDIVTIGTYEIGDFKVGDSYLDFYYLGSLEMFVANCTATQADVARGYVEITADSTSWLQYVSVKSYAANPFYLRGTHNAWAYSDSVKFSAQNDGTYILENLDIPSECAFKIADATWTLDFTTDTEITSDGEYTAVGKSDGNGSFAAEFTSFSSLKLDLTNMQIIVSGLQY